MRTLSKIPRVRSLLQGLFSAVFIFTLQAPAEKPEPLIRAWQEYQFLSLDVADKLFKDVLEMDVDDAYVLEAKVGRAMILHYREKNPDLNAAERLYREILEAEPAPEVQALVNSFLADLYLSRGQQEEALGLLDKLVDEQIDTVLGQDALIRRLTETMGSYGSTESIAAARLVEQDLERIQVPVTQERPYLLPIIHSLVGMTYFWAGDYQLSVRQFEKFTTLGNASSTSYGSQSSTLYRIATLYESQLNDPAQAGLFYRRLVEEYPNSNMSFYALEKSILLGAFSRQEANKLRMGGLTPEILDKMFKAAGQSGEVSE